jgi:m7GpppX diphosphatase
MLENVRNRGLHALKQRFGVAAENVRVYLHYLPSYYHLHVHFAHTELDLGHGVALGHAHALDDVVQ